MGLWRPGDDEPQIIANNRDNMTTALVVSYDHGDKITVDGAAIDPDAVVKEGALALKILFGRSLNDS